MYHFPALEIPRSEHWENTRAPAALISRRSALCVNCVKRLHQCKLPRTTWPPSVPPLTPPRLSFRRIAACSGQTELHLAAPPPHPLPRPLLATVTHLPPPPPLTSPNSRYLPPLVPSDLPSPLPPRPPLSLWPLPPHWSVSRRLVLRTAEQGETLNWLWRHRSALTASHTHHVCFSRKSWKRKQLLQTDTPNKRSVLRGMSLTPGHRVILMYKLHTALFQCLTNQSSSWQVNSNLRRLNCFVPSEVPGSHCSQSRTTRRVRLNVVLKKLHFAERKFLYDRI